MDDKNTERDRAEIPKLKTRPSHKDSKEMKSSGPAFLLLWVWNWFAALPTTVTNMCAGLKSSEFLSKFSIIDAMLQFIFAVATSCHPQEDGVDGEEYKNEKPSSEEIKGDLKIFGGTGRTLRSRTVTAES